MRKSYPYLLGVVATVALAAPGFAGDKADGKWKTMDANNDGFVTQAEHTAAAKRMFEKMDADRDTRVTAAEMEKSYDMHARKSAEHQASHDGRHDESHSGEMSAAEKIRKIDSNNDGVLTAAEHEQGSRRLFTEMDTDGDGRLSKEELKKGHERTSTRSDDKPVKY